MTAAVSPGHEPTVPMMTYSIASHAEPVVPVVTATTDFPVPEAWDIPAAETRVVSGDKTGVNCGCFHRVHIALFLLSMTSGNKSCGLDTLLALETWHFSRKR